MRAVDDLHDRVGDAEVRHHLFQAIEALQDVVARLTRELHQQYRIRVTHEELVHHRPEAVAVASQADHGAVHEFDRIRIERDDVPGQFHGPIERGEVDDAKHLVRRHGCQLQQQPPRPGERSFRTDQQVRQIVLTVWLDHVEVVALYPPQYPWPAGLDFGRLATRDSVDALHQGAIASRRTGHVAHRTEAIGRAIGQPGIDGLDVVHHVAVAYRTRTAGIVAGHATERCLRRGRYIDGKPQPVRSEQGVEVVQHQPRFDQGQPRLRVDLDHTAEMLGRIDHQRGADGLAALRGAAAAGQNRNPGLASDLQRHLHIVFGLRHHHADRIDLVDRGVGRIAAPAGRVEQDFAFDLAPQSLRDGRGVRGRADHCSQWGIHPELAGWFSIVIDPMVIACSPNHASGSGTGST